MVEISVMYVVDWGKTRALIGRGVYIIHILIFCPGRISFEIRWVSKKFVGLESYEYMHKYGTSRPIKDSGSPMVNDQFNKRECLISYLKWN